jgi:hypothetical protein
MLVLTPRVLGTYCCVLLMQVLCRTKKLLSGVKRALSSGPSSRGSDDNGSQVSLSTSSFMLLPHGAMGSSHYLARDDILAATDDNDISIRSTEKMEKYESLRRRELAHTHVYDVNILDRVGLNEELTTIHQTFGWEKLYDEPHLGSRLLTLEFLITFETVEKNRKSFVKFHQFRKSFGCDLYRFSVLLDFSKSCLPESSAMRNFNKVEFSDDISGKSTRLRFIDIHNPSLSFLHRWMSFTLFPMAELCSVATPELKYLFAMVNRIKYTPVADIVDYFKNVHKMSGPIECTSMVTRIAMNLGYPEMANLANIEGDVPILGLDRFIHAHILHEELDYSVSMMYARKAIRLPNPALRLYSCESLTLLFDRMGEACHSFMGPPHTHG